MLRHVASRRFVLLCVLAVLIVIALLHLPSCSPPARLGAEGGTPGSTTEPRGSSDRAGSAPVESGAAFSIDGSATEPISPGVREPLDLTLTNDHAYALTVTALQTSVLAVDAPNADATHPCTLRDFSVDQASNSIRVTVGPRAASSLTDLGVSSAQQPHVGMLNRRTNQDGCKGASLTMSYTASGILEN